MAKEDVVLAAVAEIQAGQLQALSDGLGKVFDLGVENGTGTGDDGISQATVDAAVVAALEAAKVESDKALADALAADEALDVQALADAHAEADAKLAVVQKALDDMTAKDLVDVSAVQGFSDKVAGLQSALDLIKGLLVPVPPVEPSV